MRCSSHVATGLGLQKPRQLIRARFAKEATQQTVRATAPAPVHNAHRDLGPYLLWDRALTIRATWDSRAHNQADLAAVTQLLQPHALDTITLGSTSSSSGQPLTCLTIICKPSEGDEVAAALLQFTPATHISSTACEHCFLPQHSHSVTTQWGHVNVLLSLAGSRVCKITPDLTQCEQLAAAACAGNGANGKAADGGGVVDAATVAAAAVKQLQEGLDDGSIQLGVQYLF